MSSIKKLIFFVLLYGLGSCDYDSSSKTEETPEKSETGGAQKFIQDNFSQGIPTLKIDVKIPRKEDWILSREIDLKDFNPIGIAHHKNRVFVSDTMQKIVLGIDLNGEKVDTVVQDLKVTYLNKRRAKLLMPIVDKDSIFVYRGTNRGLYKFNVPEKLERPSAFDGFKIQDYVIVDQGNNRLVRMQEDTVFVIGSLGNSEGQFDNPTSVHILGSNIHVSDTGNKRMQIFSLSDGTFTRTYGERDNLFAPTGLTSDGKNLFVCDRESKEICLYSNEGKLLYKMSKDLVSPTDIYFEEGQLYVSDANGSTIKIFANKMYDK